MVGVLDLFEKTNGFISDIADNDRILDRYNNGLSDLITVLDSQRKMFDTRGQMITVRNLIIQNRIDLLICLGGRYSET